MLVGGYVIFALGITVPGNDLRAYRRGSVGIYRMLLSRIGKQRMEKDERQ